ncbi:hypothetical protein SAMN05216474_1890 [Lishizhenia tianjinensis]|uniref:Uncharacterized protein n=1 Tax=Lishizhenia tianjinensis TaxID=477690 RepID=A0A1I7A4L8_9FLAO|nr:hypothetical protein [Lishizhenia tianjinensis]SFT69881.1 hypothetical protein SAMN05216474_1890 [Lishizhenia tianjinensis]
MNNYYKKDLLSILKFVGLLPLIFIMGIETNSTFFYFVLSFASLPFILEYVFLHRIKTGKIDHILPLDVQEKPSLKNIGLFIYLIVGLATFYCFQEYWRTDLLLYFLGLFSLLGSIRIILKLPTHTLSCYKGKFGTLLLVNNEQYFNPEKIWITQDHFIINGTEHSKRNLNLSDEDQKEIKRFLDAQFVHLDNIEIEIHPDP